jgi:hypothetical protein
MRRRRGQAEQSTARHRDVLYRAGREGSDCVTERYLEAGQRFPSYHVDLWAADRRDHELAEKIASDRAEVGNGGRTGNPSFRSDGVREP